MENVLSLTKLTRLWTIVKGKKATNWVHVVRLEIRGEDLQRDKFDDAV